MVLGAVIVLVAGIVVVVALTRDSVRTPGCTVALPGDDPSAYTFTPEQMNNAATISAVGTKLGLPAHAATVALATVLQESKLRNLEGGDRDSVGLFQQRPSQGWGTIAQLRDPVYAATEFYEKLEKLPGWETLPITVAAQGVQRSGVPDAYAQWEPQARAMAAAFNGQFPAALTCRNLTLAAPADLAAAATAELGTSRLSGPHPPAQGWMYATWLVGRAEALGVDKVSFAGRTWTAESGAWAEEPAAGQDLSLHQTAAARVSE
ncbi:hypothetical protein DV20_32910 [Amycolatopsis rifamycinica]|uniref:Co/Zn/Cd efflux system component n=1 Tax=Amycolatopsis rifamycinica TaxID=287986 RepID=A0A066TSK5_9PSEU|nr:hypothetical protein DV20_32910 [Amycolatopsis rifamycinica]